METKCETCVHSESYEISYCPEESLGTIIPEDSKLLTCNKLVGSDCVHNRAEPYKHWELREDDFIDEEEMKI